jgi:2,4-dienoyl-CoA reductase-like NADH-dependent reductase (Old Yellow Enzyme family)
MAELNSALQVGDFTIKNRLVLAPLTSVVVLSVFQTI